MTVAPHPPAQPGQPALYRFPPLGDFHAELRSRVAAYFQATSLAPQGGWRMYFDAAVVLVWLAGAYAGLVFLASTWWQAVLCGLALSGAIAAVGFKIQHDGNHGAFSRSKWVNRLAGIGLDAIGGSSFIWRQTHNHYHHGFTNLPQADNDIDLGLLGRLSPAQPHRPWHRFQHLYLWPLYAFLAVKWHWFDDFSKLWKGKIGTQPMRRPRGWDLLGLIAGKAFALTVCLVVPALFHPFPVVLLGYLGVLGVTGFLLAVVFQLAHSVGEAEHPVILDRHRALGHDWAVHQVRTTVDFARPCRWLTWFVGGLNFQVEHHLFPRIAHIHYPALSQIVEEACAGRGIPYAAHPSFPAALLAHYRFLRRMGRPDPAVINAA